MDFLETEFVDQGEVLIIRPQGSVEGYLSDWLEDDPSILTGDSFFSISGEGRRQLGLDMCGACKMTCCIDPCGFVYPCAFMQEKEFCGGNLRETSFKDIWDIAPAFDFFRHLEPVACRTCPRFNQCRGGCPAVAYFVSRDLNSADPECLANWSREKVTVPGTLDTEPSEFV